MTELFPFPNLLEQRLSGLPKTRFATLYRVRCAPNQIWDYGRPVCVSEITALLHPEQPEE